MRSPRHPNLLVLWSDQHRADVMPSAGNAVVQAPHLAKLARGSHVFSRAYCCSPVCTPSRGSILTGLWPHHHGAEINNAPLRPEARTFAEGLPAEYATGYVGKWHLGDEIVPQHGFDYWRSIEDAYRAQYRNPADRARRSDYHRFLVAEGFPPDADDGEGGAVFSRPFAAALPETFSKARFTARAAAAFLRERQDGRPFVLSVNTLEPHPPTFGPLNRRHDPAAIPVGPAFAVPVGADASRHHRRKAEKFRREGYKHHPIASASDWRRLRANYYGLVTMVDDMVGEVMAALEASGQADRTIVVYTSDHGDMLGDHGLAQKGVFYEEAVRVPLLVRVPWLAGRAFDAPFSQIDLAPTLRALMGLPPPNDRDGESRVDELARPGGRDAIVVWKDRAEPGDDGRSLVAADGWKLNLRRDDAPELYHLAEDPAEMRNLGRDKAHRDRIRRLADRVFAWQEQTGDTLPLAL